MTGNSSFIQWKNSLRTEEKNNLIRKIEQDAIDMEKEYYGCARCVLRALQQNMKGLGGGEAFRASLAMSGGIARNCEVCGALLGGLMAVGLAYGSEKLAFPFGSYVKTKKQDDEVAEKYRDVMGRAGKICEMFKEIYGSLRCADVQRAIRGGKFWDLRDQKQLSEYLQPAIHDQCGQVAGTVAKLTAQIMLG
jgi:hypothetical protein